MFSWIANSVSLLARGGIVMIPLLICSILSITVIIERCITLGKASHNPGDLMHELGNLIRQGQIQKAYRLCEETPCPITHVLSKGLQEFLLKSDRLDQVMEEQALVEIPKLQKNLTVLDTIITIAPLLGLLGTVTGMIGSFHIISSTGVSQPNAITGGVAEALIATATGLTIAIITLIAYNYLCDRVKYITNQMEICSTQLINRLSTVGEIKDEIKTTRA